MMFHPRHRPGFTLLEVTFVSGLMAVLVLVISRAWIGIGRPIADTITRSQLLQETDMVVAALTRDLNGSLANPAGRLGNKNMGRWVGWRQLSLNEFQLCFDGGTNPDGQPQWGPPDTVISYTLQSNGTLVRTDENAGTTFTVAKNISNMTITSNLVSMQIQFTFSYRGSTRTCTLNARTPTNP
jgi:type II secretory pathway component PulJ